MSTPIEIGIFIPTVQTGWIPSENTPHTPGSFAHALSVVQRAERMGFDFVLSPQNWRGAEGPSRYWRDSVESLMATSALLQATERIEVWGTAHVLVYPPALIAKMMASLSEIGHGRVGMNVVTGGHYMSFGPLGFWDDSLDHDQLYDVAQEWLSVVKKLWTEPSVDHEGERFKLFDARLDPKPLKRPRIVNAGASPRGMRFAVENCDVAFMLAGEDIPSFKESATRAHEMAKELEKPDFKIYGLMTLIPGETDLEAQALMDHLESGVDLEALADMEQGYRKNVKGFKDLSSSSLATLGGDTYRSVMPGTLIGSYDTLARRIAESVENYGLGGLLIIVPDYTEHLPKLAERTFPKLAEYGIECNVHYAN